MSNIKILLASVLKPVNDTRMYEKIGMALAKIDKAEIHIAGFHANNVEHDNKIEFHPLFNFNRISIQRLWASWKIWRLLLKVKPQVIIANTHELLIVIVSYKILFGCRVFYDVQENYFRNLWYGQQFPGFIKQILAIYVRLKEKLLAPFVETFILAEQCYTREMPFMLKKGVIIENKFKKPDQFKVPGSRDKAPLSIVYSGIIAEIYGIFEVIRLARQLLDLAEGTFTIIGHCPDRQLLNKVRKAIENDKRIQLIGGENYVPHQKILDVLSISNMGLIGYRNNPSISDRFPTRLFEYMAYRLPFIMPENKLWQHQTYKYNACIAIDYSSYQPEYVLKEFQSKIFYTSIPGNEIYFNQDESLLKQLILR